MQHSSVVNNEAVSFPRRENFACRFVSCVLLSVFFTSAPCRAGNELETIQAKVADLEKQNVSFAESKARELAALKQQQETDLAALRKTNEDLKIKVSTEKQTVAVRDEKIGHLESELKGSIDNLAAYKSKYRANIRAHAANTVLGKVITNEGKTFENVKITRVDPDGLLISHSNGGAKLKFKDLEPDLRERYAYDVSEAEAFEKETASKQPPVPVQNIVISAPK